MDKKKGQPLLVTTKYRGVFFGYGEPSDSPTITLRNARMCVYWSGDLRNVLGLASHGPNEKCRIGFAVPELILRDVTACTSVTPQAAEKWEAEPWSQ